MSFLVEDADRVATLEEALAFIDSLELDDSSSSSSRSDANDASGSLRRNTKKIPSGGDTFRHQHASTTKKRKRSNLSSSTRLQQRKKAEILYLRRRAQELEEQLLQLRQQPCSTQTLTASSPATWMQLAQANYQARLRSEEINRTLRAIMASQVQDNDSVGDVLQIQVSFQENDMKYTEPLTTPGIADRGGLLVTELRSSIPCVQQNFVIEDSDRQPDIF
ncbi:hypothetical protein PHYPSEUDO_010579 [Phytophthora pseudosyringae]|uniref:BZIP domain-containing protein n=1 Tax=Phytophthora pseudosyringae TaxID=221518 RepID=A0A8T1V9X2_9STRA|nr:hypothetical protein PHYPSEUDO_010579 [Phytophthora pseudosyringae]